MTTKGLIEEVLVQTLAEAGASIDRSRSNRIGDQLINALMNFLIKINKPIDQLIY